MLLCLVLRPSASLTHWKEKTYSDNSLPLITVLDVRKGCFSLWKFWFSNSNFNKWCQPLFFWQNQFPGIPSQLKVESGQGEGFLFKPFHSHLLAASGWGCTNGFLLHSIQRPSILLSLVDACEVVHYSLLKVFCLPLNHLIGDSTTPRKFASGKTFKISNRWPGSGLLTQRILMLTRL